MPEKILLYEIATAVRNLSAPFFAPFDPCWHVQKEKKMLSGHHLRTFQQKTKPALRPEASHTRRRKADLFNAALPQAKIRGDNVNVTKGTSVFLFLRKKIFQLKFNHIVTFSNCFSILINNTKSMPSVLEFLSAYTELIVVPFTKKNNPGPRLIIILHWILVTIF